MPDHKPKKKRSEQAASRPKPQQPSPDQPEAPSQAERDRQFRHTLDHVREAANRGDPRAQQAIKQCISVSPGLCQQFGNLATHAETALIKLVSGGEVLTATAITQQAARMRRDLAGPAPTLLEEMAAQRVVACWLGLQHCEMEFLHNQASVHWARYWLARQAQADKLYRQAVRSLVLVRELLPATPQSGAPAEAGPHVDAQHDHANGTHVPRVAEEPLSANGCDVNRFAVLAAYRDDASGCVAAGVANAQPRLNGHRNRFQGLLGACADG